MNNQKETIRKFVGYINNKEHLGGFWLPNIQRAFVWGEDQIERLYDSILREYPIGNLLIWRNKSKIKHRKFIDNWNENINLLTFNNPVNENPKMLVLDGQQRMQSLYIGLCGSFNGKELYFNILSGDLKTPDDMKYDFKFFAKPLGFPWLKFSNLVFPDKRNKEFKADIAKLAGKGFSEQEEDRVEENIDLVRAVFCTQENIVYQEVDSIDRPQSYTDDDIVEIFIRANSGGTKLDKSDLLFSLLVSSWETADENMGDLLQDLNKDGFDFGRDFILKTCLVIFDKGAAYKVEKFRDGETKKKIEENWAKITRAIKDVKDFLWGKTFIKSDKVLSSYLALIPLIYFRYHYHDKWQKAKGMNEYLVRVLLASAFSGSPDGLIDKCVTKIKTLSDFNKNEIFGVIRDEGRSLEISKDTLLDISYTDRRIHLLFNLWYDFDYDPSYVNNEPQLDHIHCQSLLKTFKDINPETGRKTLSKYKQHDRDQIANIMLLTRLENGSGGKSDETAEEWFTKHGDDEYLEKHLIPKDKNIWKVENFEAFIEERKKLILAKFDNLLIKDS